MPDRDILDRFPVPAWRTPHKLLCGAATPLEVADSVSRSLAKSLRIGGGLPGISDFAHLMRLLASGNITPLKAMEQTRAIERQTLGHRHSKIAAEEIRKWIVEFEQGGPVPADPLQFITERLCWAMVDHHLLGRDRPEFFGGRFRNASETLVFEMQCKEQLRPLLLQLAKRLAKNSTGRGLRAPRRPKGVQLATKDILEMSLVS